MILDEGSDALIPFLLGLAQRKRGLGKIANLNFFKLTK